MLRWGVISFPIRRVLCWRCIEWLIIAICTARSLINVAISVFFCLYNLVSPNTARNNEVDMPTVIHRVKVSVSVRYEAVGRWEWSKENVDREFGTIGTIWLATNELFALLKFTIVLKAIIK